MYFFFIEVKFTYKRINHCKVYKSVAFSVFTMSYSTTSLWRQCFFITSERHPSLSTHCPLLSSPHNHYCAFCLCGYAYSEYIIKKRNPSLKQTFCVCFFLSIMSANFIQGVACISTPWLYMTALYSILCMCHNMFHMFPLMSVWIVSTCNELGSI